MLNAVQANDLPAVIDAIKRGADVNKRGPTPYTPLMIAAGRGPPSGQGVSVLRNSGYCRMYASR